MRSSYRYGGGGQESKKWLGAQTTDKKCWNGKVPMVIRSPGYRSVVGVKGLLLGRKGDESVILRARFRK